MRSLLVKHLSALLIMALALSAFAFAEDVATPVSPLDAEADVAVETAPEAPERMVAAEPAEAREEAPDAPEEASGAESAEPSEEAADADAPVAVAAVEAVADELPEIDLIDPAQADYVDFEPGEARAEIDAALGLLMEGDAGIKIDDANFPDAAFKAYVLETVDSDKDQRLSQAEINATTEMTLQSPASVKGIEYFTELQFLKLNRWSNEVSLIDLDLSSNTKLKTLECSHDHVGSLNLAGCTALETLICTGNALTSLDVSSCASLQVLNCASNQLSELNLSGFTTLKELYCDYNKLTSLNISGCTALQKINCENNSLTSLSINGFTDLQELCCASNKMTTLDASGCTSLMLLWCYSNELTGLNIDNDEALSCLYCDLNKLTTLDLSKCARLSSLIRSTSPYVDEEMGVIYGDDDNIRPGLMLHYLMCDRDLTLLLYAEATSSTSAPGTLSMPAMPTISAIKKRGKVKITAAPGSIYQLDLGGATGKKFKSSKKKIATVNSSGLVTVKKAGKTRITFKVGKKTRTVILTVKDPTIPSAIALNLSGTVAAQVGVPQTLTVTLPEGTNSGIKWKSSNKKIARVSGGVVTFKKAGKVTITATAKRGKKKAKVKFKVSK